MNILSHIGFILEINNAIHEDNTKIVLNYYMLIWILLWVEMKEKIEYILLDKLTTKKFGIQM